MTSNQSLAPHSIDLRNVTINKVTGNQTISYILPPSAIPDPSPCHSFNDAPLDLLSGDFTGREQEMARVVEFLEANHGDIPSRCALHGMHGVGKSQVSYALAKDLFDHCRYTHVFYIQAGSVEKLCVGFSRVLCLVSHPEQYAPERDARLLAARRWLEEFSGGKWLLIFDNVVRETVEFLRHQLPRKNRNGSILFTTLTEVVAKALTHVAGVQHGIVEMHVPDVADATKLLLKHLGNHNAAIADENQVRDVVQGVGCLPLAIAQVTAYMAESCITLGELLALLKSERKIELINWENNLLRYQEKTIASAFVGHLHDLDRHFPSAADLLKVMAYLNTENISLEVLTHGAAAVSTVCLPASVASLSVKKSFAKKITAKLRASKSAGKRAGSIDHSNVITVTMSSLLSLIQSPTHLNNALMQLQNRSLIERRQEAGNSSMWMHRLVQIVVLEDSKTNGKERDWLENAVQLMCRALEQIPEPTSREAWRRCQVLVPHIQSLTMHKAVSETPRMSILLTNGLEGVMRYMADHGRYDDMYELNRHCFLWTTQLHGSTHTTTLVAKCCLGLSYLGQGCDRDAEQVLQAVVQAWTKHFELENNDALLAMQALANVYQSCGRYEDAECLLLQVVQYRKKQFGLEHDTALSAMQDLASVYLSQVRYTDAEHLLDEVLRCHKKQFGLEHDRTFSTMRGLAWVYRLQGRYKDAEHLLDQVLRFIDKRTGGELESMFIAVVTLAMIYHHQGRYKDAEEKLDQALQYNRNRFGSGHLLTLPAMSNLARVYQAQGRYKDAQRLYDDVMCYYKKRFGFEHHSMSRLSTFISTIILNLASVHESQGHYDEACHLLEVWAGIHHLSQEHPHVLAGQQQLASIHRLQGRYHKAEAICNQVLQGRRTQLGTDHDDTLWTMHQLACVYRDQGRLDEAEALFLKVHLMQHQQRDLGPEHIRTVATMHELASVYLLQQRYSEAQGILTKVLERRDESLGHNHPHTRQTLELLAQSYIQLSQLADADFINQRLNQST